ncbi:MAG: peptidase family protein [Candidatus Solibacter sp.]|nr:peptidase family protein [Candidatus Solibacter sp.]
MRILRIGLVAASISASVFGQGVGAKGVGTKGIEPGDINRDADPCTDFYDFANGAWRARNPIPPAMQRWSRRWAAGESSKDRLKEILDDVAAKPGQPAGSVRQEIGDFYGACMDERAINRAGIMMVECWR